MRLTPDEAEFLWAVVKRPALPIRLPRDAMERLVKADFICVDGDWATLTPRGRNALADRELSLTSECLALWTPSGLGRSRP